MRGVRRFQLHRDAAVSGISGAGIVADGTQFPKECAITWPDGAVLHLPAGWVRLVWRGAYRSTVLWDSPEQAMAVHGHGGATRLVWLDPQ